MTGQVIAHWQRLDNGIWGVAVRGAPGTTRGLSGREIDVRKKDGSSSVVTLGRRVASWNADRTSIYTIRRG